MDIRELSNVKEGYEMPMSKTVEAKREELIQAARLLGENLSRRSFGERGPDLNVTLADLEGFLRPLVQAMAGGFLAVSASEQAQRLAETLPCPTCGRECSPEGVASRPPRDRARCSSWRGSRSARRKCCGSPNRSARSCSHSVSTTRTCSGGVS